MDIALHGVMGRQNKAIEGKDGDVLQHIPGSGRSSISIPTALGWIKKYKDGGCRIDSLKPKGRRDYGRHRKLDDRIRMAIRDLKIENPQYTVPAIIGKLRALEIIGSSDEISRPTIYRFLAKEEMGRPSSDALDRKRFEADHSNEIWQISYQVIISHIFD